MTTLSPQKRSYLCNHCKKIVFLSNKTILLSEGCKKPNVLHHQCQGTEKKNTKCYMDGFCGVCWDKQKNMSSKTPCFIKVLLD